MGEEAEHPEFDAGEPHHRLTTSVRPVHLPGHVRPLSGLAPSDISLPWMAKSSSPSPRRPHIAVPPLKLYEGRLLRPEHLHPLDAHVKDPCNPASCTDADRASAHLALISQTVRRRSGCPH